MRILSFVLLSSVALGVVADPRSPGKPAAPVRIEHRLLAEPVKGQPLDIEVAVTPTGRLGDWQVSVSGDVALGLSKTPRAVQLGKPEAGATQSFRVRVLPTAEGVFDLDVRVSGELGGLTQVKNQSFGIPVGRDAVRRLIPVGTRATGPGRDVVVLPAETRR